MIHYPNVSRLIGAVISTRLASLHELDTIYGVEDCFDLLEVARVDALNQKIIDKAATNQR